MRWTDWVLLLACACLVAVGPAMALQEAARAQDQRAEERVTGKLPAVDGSFRLLWRLPLGGLVFLVGLVGSLTAARSLWDVGVRRVSGRVLFLLLVGLALLYVTYYVDGRFFLDAPYLLRGMSVVWLYAAGGILVGGSVHRLADLQDHFGRARGGAEFRI